MICFKINNRELRWHSAFTSAKRLDEVPYTQGQMWVVSADSRGWYWVCFENPRAAEVFERYLRQNHVAVVKPGEPPQEMIQLAIALLEM